MISVYLCKRVYFIGCRWAVTSLTELWLQNRRAHILLYSFMLPVSIFSDCVLQIWSSQFHVSSNWTFCNWRIFRHAKVWFLLLVLLILPYKEEMDYSLRSHVDSVNQGTKFPFRAIWSPLKNGVLFVHRKRTGMTTYQHKKNNKIKKCYTTPRGPPFVIHQEIEL